MSSHAVAQTTFLKLVIAKLEILTIILIQAD